MIFAVLDVSLIIGLNIGETDKVFYINFNKWTISYVAISISLCIYSIIRQDFQLKCLKKQRVQELTTATVYISHSCYKVEWWLGGLLVERRTNVS